MFITTQCSQLPPTHPTDPFDTLFISFFLIQPLICYSFRPYIPILYTGRIIIKYEPKKLWCSNSDWASWPRMVLWSCNVFVQERRIEGGAVASSIHRLSLSACFRPLNDRGFGGGRCIPILVVPERKCGSVTRRRDSKPDAVRCSAEVRAASCVLEESVVIVPV